MSRMLDLEKSNKLYLKIYFLFVWKVISHFIFIIVS